MALLGNLFSAWLTRCCLNLFYWFIQFIENLGLICGSRRAYPSCFVMWDRLRIDNAVITLINKKIISPKPSQPNINQYTHLTGYLSFASVSLSLLIKGRWSNFWIIWNHTRIPQSKVQLNSCIPLWTLLFFHQKSYYWSTVIHF